MEIPRSTIDEVITKYSLEPKLRDIYVEGSFDKEILELRIARAGLRDISLYEIDSIEIGEDALRKYGLTAGNKQRVMALAHSLVEALDGEFEYKCIVDRDLDHWLGYMREVNGLIYTKYCDIEGYFLHSATVQKMIVTICKSKVSDWSIFFESMISVLRFLYATRVASARRGWSLTWVDVGRSLELIEDRLSITRDQYILKILQKNRLAPEFESFSKEVAAVEIELGVDHFLFIRGHDFVEIAAKSFAALKGVKNLATADALERILVAMVDDVSDLDALLA